MARPWPDRADSHPTLELPRPAPRRNKAAPARFSNSIRLDEFELLDGSQIHASSSDDDDGERIHPTSRPKSSHARSMSQPFPSLFTSKKKKPGLPMPGLSDSDSTDEAAPMPKSKGKSHARSRGNGPGLGSTDFATGNCMTCGSLVRWPKTLAVFKCTICLTVNDRHTTAVDDEKDRAPERISPTAGTFPRPHRPPPNPDPLSLEHTRTVIIHCLRTFLQQYLVDHDMIGPEVLGHAPGASSSHTAHNGRPTKLSARDYVHPTGKSPPIYVTTPVVERTQNQDFQINTPRRPSLTPRSYSTSYPDRRPALRGIDSQRSSSPHSAPTIFKALEDYIVGSITSFRCLNSSFVNNRSASDAQPGRDITRKHQPGQRKDVAHDDHHPLADLDAKILLLGDFAENGSWWTGQDDAHLTRTASHKNNGAPSLVSSRSPHINWSELQDWYVAVVNCGQRWRTAYDEIIREDPALAANDAKLRDIESLILSAQQHVHRTLLKATDSILKRPGRPLTKPSEIRFLLIILSNPLLHASSKQFVGEYDHAVGRATETSCQTTRGSGPAAGQHSGVIKRILGLLSNLPNECHGHLVSWFARYPRSHFVRAKDLVGGFLAYRLIRQSEKKHEVKVDVTDGLIPSMSDGRSPASLHAALGAVSVSAKKHVEQPKKMMYQDDWQIKAAAKVMALIFAANNSVLPRRRLSETSPPQGDDDGLTTRDQVGARGQLLPTSDFYVTLLDNADLLADFEAWEHKKGKFSFCQYPFLLSIGAKIQILEHDARRQMQSKARDAFFDSIISRKAIDQYLILNVRRDCLVEDSLKAVSEVIGSGSEDVKKGLRIIFRGEEGVDAGGLRKEWFLLLVREVFNPDHGMFVYDEDSLYCYFNPNSFETSDQFFLVGVVLGLAIYNSTILDVALPPFAFRKLLHSAPVPATMSSTQSRPIITYTLDDLAEYRPRLAKSLRQLLDYEGDVESTFCLDFVVDVDKYGSIEQVPLCAAGAQRAVTNANRREYVDLYVRHVLDTAVTRQFEPFKRGFFTVCGGNALSLFRHEEIELLVRGSDEPLDIGALRSAAAYDNWGPSSVDPGETEATVRWFWQTFEDASPKDQRKLLLFVTGSDRIPAVGAASLSIRIVCLGDDCGRYPTARTCFNVLALWRYTSRERLESMLWTAVNESEGFGLK